MENKVLPKRLKLIFARNEVQCHAMVQGRIAGFKLRALVRSHSEQQHQNPPDDRPYTTCSYNPYRYRLYHLFYFEQIHQQRHRAFQPTAGHGAKP
ncbi:MAG TPA: hypothetical protein VFX82_03335 [Desulfobacterales bacterium]|nr:hypothetical protein [Desulfobacterales bacterium]